MAKFIFKMENILNIKLKLEEQCKTAYSLARAALNAEEEKLEGLKHERVLYEDKVREMTQGHLDLPELNRCYRGMQVLDELIKIQMLEVRRAEQVLEKARQQLNEAMKERKTYEKLKEKAFEVFLQELEAEDKKAIDELVSYQYNNRSEEIE